jgi:hypothetical protein
VGGGRPTQREEAVTGHAHGGAVALQRGRPVARGRLDGRAQPGPRRSRLRRVQRKRVARVVTFTQAVHGVRRAVLQQRGVLLVWSCTPPAREVS